MDSNDDRYLRVINCLLACQHLYNVAGITSRDQAIIFNRAAIEFHSAVDELKDGDMELVEQILNKSADKGHMAKTRRQIEQLVNITASLTPEELEWAEDFEARIRGI